MVDTVVLAKIQQQIKENAAAWQGKEFSLTLWAQAHCVTQDEIADARGVSRGTVNSWIKGRTSSRDFNWREWSAKWSPVFLASKPLSIDTHPALYERSGYRAGDARGRRFHVSKRNTHPLYGQRGDGVLQDLYGVEYIARMLVLGKTPGRHVVAWPAPVPLCTMAHMPGSLVFTLA